MYSAFTLLLFLFSIHIFIVAANLDCKADSFSSILPKNTTITLAAPTTNFSPFLQKDVNITFPSNITEAALPICVLELNVKSSHNTSFNTGVILPNSWNGRLLATGNPGFSGGIRWSSQADVLRYGPAVTVSTDTGHVGSANNISFAINNPDGILDWSYRSLHDSTVLAKQLAKTFYGNDVQHSYYSSCSNGGRQGLKEVQMFPDDYDGVLAGAPAWDITHLHPYIVQIGIWNLPANTSSHIPSDKFSLISDHILEQCDSQDGLADRIIQEPYSCDFSSTMIVCNATTESNDTCLTPSEIDTLSLLYNDWTRENGSLLFPHFALSASISHYGAVDTAPEHFGLEYFDGFVYNETNWDWRTFQGEKTVDFVDSLDAGHAAALSMDLSEFKSHGGKLIMYHGLSDNTIPTGSSIQYFQGVSTTMGSIDDFLQLYLVPGMGHCGGSAVAPYYIAADGQVVQTTDGPGFSVPGYVDPQHDILLAMMEWVENGTAPNQLIATKWNNDTLENGLLMQRPLCPYPQKAVYKGSGNYHDPRTWSCQEGELLEFPTMNGSRGTVKAFDNSTTTSGQSSSSTGPAQPTSTGHIKGGANKKRVMGEDTLQLAGCAFLGLLGVGHMLLD